MCNLGLYSSALRDKPKIWLSTGRLGLNCCVVIIVCDVEPPVSQPKGGSVGDTVLYLWSAGPTPKDVSHSGTQAQWHSFCQTWLCFGRRKNAELCWHISGKAADMARLADYFIVVGYDQEKAGKFGRLCEADVRVQAASQCVLLMLMLHSCG